MPAPDLPNKLSLALMIAVALAFIGLHQALRRLPFRQFVPRERFRWPVWNWYALVVGIGIVLGLAANLYWNARTPVRSSAREAPPAWEIRPTAGRGR